MSTAPTVPQRQNVVYAALIALETDALLLPNAALIDVLSPGVMREADADAQVHGCVGWIDGDDGLSLPVLSFEALLGGEIPPPTLRSRLVVLQGLDGSAARVVVLAQAAPKRISLMPMVLTEDDGDTPASPFVTHHCRVAQQRVHLPDLAALEQRSEALRTPPAATPPDEPPAPSPATVSRVDLKAFDQNL